MRNALLALVVPVALSIGCGSGSGSPSPGGSGGGGPGGGNGGSSSSTGGAGNPNGSCSAGVPAKGQPADTSSPTTVVGTGTASSCTFAALRTAAAAGGVITFDCGGGNVTIQVTETLSLPINKNTVIDGGNRITLDGGGATRIISFDSPNWRATDFGVTLQHIRLVNGKATPTEAIPTAPAPCSQGWNDGQGGARLHARRIPDCHRRRVRRQPGRAAGPRHGRRRDLRAGQQGRCRGSWAARSRTTAPPTRAPWAACSRS